MAKGNNNGKKAHKLAAVETYTAGPDFSISDPALAEFLGLSGIYGTSSITEFQALQLTAVYRAQALIAGTIAGLPLKVYSQDIEDAGGSSRNEIPHFLSSKPAGPYDLSAFSWTETIVLHLLNHGEAFLAAVSNGGGELVGLFPTHPLAITKVDWDGATKIFTIAQQTGGSLKLNTGEMTQVLGMSIDGLRGISPLSIFRQSLQTSRAGELAANRTFAGGALMAGMVTSDEDIDELEAKQIKDSLKAKAFGAEHAGDIAFINRSLKFTPWAMTNADAEFIASRSFQIDEVARIYGVPSHLLMSTEKVTSWGAGIQEQDLALAKYTLMAITSRIESALSALLPDGQFVEFQYSGLLAGTPAQEIELLIAQVEAGILTVDEARAIRNLPPLTPEQKAEAKPAPPAPMPTAATTGAASSPKD